MKNKLTVLLILFLIITFSFSCQAKQIKIFYQGEEISDKLDLITDSEVNSVPIGHKINIDNLKIFGVEISKEIDTENRIYTLKKSKINLKFYLSKGNYGWELVELHYNDGEKHIFKDLDDIDDYKLEYAFMDNYIFDNKFYIHITAILEVLNFDVEKEDFFEPENIKVYQPNTFAMWEEQEKRELKSKRTEQFNEIKSTYSFLDQETLSEIEKKIFNDNKIINRVLTYLKNKDVDRETIKRLFKGKIWFGMTPEQLKAVKGKPKSINTTQTKNFIHQQWVYSVLGHEYYYFENGELVTVQN